MTKKLYEIQYLGIIKRTQAYLIKIIQQNNQVKIDMKVLKVLQNFGRSAKNILEGHLSYKKLLDGNKEYVAKKLKESPSYFKNLAKGQKPRQLIIGCSDSRVDVTTVTDTDLGDIFIHRNIANSVIHTDANLNSVIHYAVDGLKVRNIIVLGHTRCGGVEAACNHKSYGGFLDSWLIQIRSIYDKNYDTIKHLPRQQQYDKMVEFNVRQNVRNIWKNFYVQRSWSRGFPIWVHGWIMKVETGLIEEVTVDAQMPELMKRYKYKFEEQIKKDRKPHRKLRRVEKLVEEYQEIMKKSRESVR